jgi:hypothetical protein
MDQDNFWYRGDDCRQANHGQQISGKDNDAAGEDVVMDDSITFSVYQ